MANGEQKKQRIAELEKTLLKASVDSGNLALRALILINGGAAVAVLAFVGNLIGQARVPHANPNSVAVSLILFALGVVAGAAGMGLFYWFNFFTGREASALTLTDEPPT
jgi:hypothetical protein